MIAEWMLYCALCALGLFAAAAVVERWLLNAGAQVRHVWTVALLLSIAIPAATYWFSPRNIVTISPIVSGAPSAPDLTGAAEPTEITTPAAPVVVRGESLRKAIPSDGFVVGVWIAFSAALFIYLVTGIVALARMRRHWHPSDVCGVKVLVSETTGPAVVNAFAPQIVMPEWALAMDRYQLGLMIRHEQEHRRAADPQLLALAQIALVAMPWNPALWWGVQRLGMAVELDCDARVLRTADPRTYGDLLLEVARPRRHPRLVPIAAFAERTGGLERRIRAIARRRDRVTRGARVGAAIVGLVVVGIAWVAPHPSLPPRVSFAAPAPVATTPTDSALDTSLALENSKPAPIAPETLVKRKNRVFVGDTAILPTMKAVGDDVIVAPPARPAFSAADSLFYDRLFTGVQLPPDQELAARLLLSNLAQLQVDQDRQLLVSGVQNALVRLQIGKERDSALFALLPNDADRELIGSRLAAMQLGGGRRGRSANPPGLTLPVDVPVGGGARGRGRVGGGGGGASTQEVPVSASIDDVIFNSVFDGVALSAEQQVTARSILSTYRQKLVATIPDPVPFQLRMQGTTGVLMRPESRTTLLAILSNDADRAVVDSRILTETRVTVVRPPATPPSR